MLESIERRRRDAPGAFLFFGVFTGFGELLDAAGEEIAARWGPLHPLGISPRWPFPATRTYGRTMGDDLVRRFFVTNELFPQDGLARVKHAAIELEDRLASTGDYGVERPVNIDPGLLNDCRIILASTRDHAHRIYRGQGIWEEITLLWRHGAFEALPWTYPDFREPTYHSFFAELRRDLLERQSRKG